MERRAATPNRPLIVMVASWILLPDAKKIRKAEKNFKRKKFLRCRKSGRAQQGPLEMRSSFPKSPAVEPPFAGLDIRAPG
jgi:hypothetical protein